MGKFGMVAVVLASACSSDADEIDAPDDCAADELHIVHADIDERLTVTNHGFINKLSADTNGTLDLGRSQPNSVHLEWPVLLGNGDSASTFGWVKLESGLDVGNCATDGEFPGTFHIVESGVWRWELRDLRTGPDYCAGAIVAASLGGCYRTE